MKMAKASQADLDAAIKITSALESLELGFMPDGVCDGGNEREEFFIDYASHCRIALTHILDLMDQGRLARVVWGMYTLLDPENKLLDPDVGHLALHPDLSDAGKMRKERDDALAKVSMLEARKESAA